MLSVATLNKTPVTVEWLTSRTFTFRAEPTGVTISNTFVFHRNGFIVGYSHPNESHWEIAGEGVRILDQNGLATCELTIRLLEDERIQLAGLFRNPAAGYEQTPVTHILEENESDEHARIQSFDLFDTLVARRSPDPLEVFRTVEARSGVAGFAARRHAVEMAIFGRRTYGLQDVYDLMVGEAFLSDRQAKVLQLMELEEEWNTLFPIREIVARVNPGDIIISDMYLPRPFVERILKEKCGLDNKLYLSNYGKHQRLIWPSILETYKLRTHFGDNLHADVVGASACGIAPTFVSISKWDKTEEILHATGLSAYAKALRVTRLENFNRNPKVMNALRAQISVNIPLMILGSFWIRHCASHFGANRILTASRDCNLWDRLLSSKHFARCGMPETSYIQISRALCYDEAEAYEAYFRGKLADRNLLVDVVGTGKSLSHFVARLGLQQRVRPCVMVADPNLPPDAGTVETLLLKNFAHYRIFLEGLNASLDGSAVTAEIDEIGPKVLNQPNEFNNFMRLIIIEMRAAFERFLPSLDTFAPPSELPSPDAVGAAADAIIEMLPGQGMKLATLHYQQGINLARGNVSNLATA